MPIQTKVSLPAEEVNVEAKDEFYPFFSINPNENIALNEIGTAKVMCRCSGTPGFMKKVRSLEDIKDHGRLCLRRNSRSQKRELSQTLQASNKTEANFESDRKTVSMEVSSKPKEAEAKSNFSNPEKTSHNSSANRDALSNLENLKSPYSFSVFWSSIKGTDDLTLVAKALRVLCPDQMSQGMLIISCVS